MSIFQPQILLLAGQIATRIVQQADGENATRTIISRPRVHWSAVGIAMPTSRRTGGATVPGKTVGKTGRRSEHRACAETAMVSIRATMIGASGLHVKTSS